MNFWHLQEQGMISVIDWKHAHPNMIKLFDYVVNADHLFKAYKGIG